MKYPVFLSLSGQKCIVVGLGNVGLRKLQGLLSSDVAAVLALDTQPLDCLSPDGRRLLADTRVSFANRPFAVTDLPCFLVFAATSDADENRRIAGLCQSSRVLCDCVTEPDRGSFILPAVARAGDLQVALSTGGGSPFLARRWREDLQNWVEVRANVAWLAGRLRQCITPLQDHRGILQNLGVCLEHFLETGDLLACKEQIVKLLPFVPASELDKIFELFEVMEALSDCSHSS